MDLSDIALIRAIQQTGSLSQAASALNMSQPTLSKKLARLEDQLKVALFHRHARGLTPTAIALHILDKQEPLQQGMAAIERYIALLSAQQTGTVRLGVGPIVEQLLLPDVLTAFLDDTGAAQLSLVTEHDTTLLSQFAASQLDIIVGPFAPADYAVPQVISIPMIEDDIIAAVRPNHPILVHGAKAGAHLTDYPFVNPLPQGTMRTDNAELPGLPTKISADNYDLLKKLTFARDVICAGPRAVFAAELAEKSLIEITLPVPVRWQSCLLVRPEVADTPLARHLIGLFESAADKTAAALKKPA